MSFVIEAVILNYSILLNGDKYETNNQQIIIHILESYFKIIHHSLELVKITSVIQYYTSELIPLKTV